MHTLRPQTIRGLFLRFALVVIEVTGRGSCVATMPVALAIQ